MVGFTIGLLAAIFEWERTFELPDLALGLSAIHFGLSAQCGLRLLLKRNGSKTLKAQLASAFWMASVDYKFIGGESRLGHVDKLYPKHLHCR